MDGQGEFDPKRPGDAAPRGRADGDAPAKETQTTRPGKRPPPRPPSAGPSPRGRATPVPVPVAPKAAHRPPPKAPPAGRDDPGEETSARRRGRRPARVSEAMPTTPSAVAPSQPSTTGVDPTAPPPRRKAPSARRAEDGAADPAPRRKMVGGPLEHGPGAGAAQRPARRTGAPATRDTIDAPTARPAPAAAPAQDEALAPRPDTAAEHRVPNGARPATPAPASERAPRRTARARPVTARVITDGGQTPLAAAPLVAPNTVAARALGAVIAILTFVCAVLWGGVVLLDRTTEAWSASVRGEITVTVAPLMDAPLTERVEAVAAILAEDPALTGVTVLSAADAEALLEPWLGTELDLAVLPVPRLVTATRAGALDSDALASRLARVPGTVLDDHTAASAAVSRVALRATTAAMIALVLMITVTAFSVVFATRAAVAANAACIDVLVLLGAEEGFVVRAFRGPILRVAAVSALLGVAASAGVFGLAALSTLLGEVGAPFGFAPFFGDINIGSAGFVGIAVIGAGFVLLTQVVAGWTVRQELRRQEALS